jgi:hypothetical protein
VVTKIGYIISSYYEYHDYCYPRIIRSLTRAGIGYEDIFGFIADKTEERVGNVYHINHNSYDFNALIGTVENQDSVFEGYSHLFLLHETCIAGKHFKDLVENNFDTSVNYTSICGFMTMGMFRKDYLLSERDFILSQKNISKERAIELEDHFYKSNSKICYDRSKYMGNSEHYIRLRARSYRHHHHNVCYFPYLDLYKMTKY